MQPRDEIEGRLDARVAAHSLAGVAETSLIPLWARAVETRKTRGMLEDPKAVAILEALDCDLSKLEDCHGSQVGCCLRGMVFDEWVRGLLDSHATGTVVEIGAGLGTRSSRLDDSRAYWFDLDLPEVATLRRLFFHEDERRRILSSSVLDPAWMDAVLKSPGPHLFVAEAVLFFLPQAAVKDLLSEMARRFPGAGLLLDGITTWLLDRQERHDALRHMDARFAWALDDPRALGTWDPRLRVEEVLDFPRMIQRVRRRLPEQLQRLGDMAGDALPEFAGAHWLARLRFV